MSEQNKNAGNAQGGTTSKPAPTDNKGTVPSTDQREQAGNKTPNHEQGREYTPNVNAQRESADARRTSEQSHVPNATSHDTDARKDNEAEDAKRAKAEGRPDQKSRNEQGKIVAGPDSKYKG